MRYLLDANVLISLALENHIFHSRVERWIHSFQKGKDELAACAITELAFVRILVQLPEIDITIADAKNLLSKIKSKGRLRFLFIHDDVKADRLPSWVKTAKQITDGHLVELAKAHEAILATLDEKIAEAYLIREL